MDFSAALNLCLPRSLCYLYLYLYHHTLRKILAVLTETDIGAVVASVSVSASPADVDSVHHVAYAVSPAYVAAAAVGGDEVVQLALRRQPIADKGAT